MPCLIRDVGHERRHQYQVRNKNCKGLILTHVIYFYLFNISQVLQSSAIESWILLNSEGRTISVCRTVSQATWQTWLISNVNCRSKLQDVNIDESDYIDLVIVRIESMHDHTCFVHFFVFSTNTGPTVHGFTVSAKPDFEF